MTNLEPQIGEPRVSFSNNHRFVDWQVQAAGFVKRMRDEGAKIACRSRASLLALRKGLEGKNIEAEPFGNPV